MTDSPATDARPGSPVDAALLPGALVTVAALAGGTPAAAAAGSPSTDRADDNAEPEDCTRIRVQSSGQAVVSGSIVASPVPAPAPPAATPVGSSTPVGSGAPVGSAGRVGPGSAGRNQPTHGHLNTKPEDSTRIRVQSSSSEFAAWSAAGSSAVSAAPAPPPLTPAAPIGAPTSIDPPGPSVTHEAVQPALTSALAHLRKGPDGVHELEVTLHPADLGTVQVRVSMHHGVLDVTVACAHEAARDAVTAALPSLHRDLACSVGVEVGPPRPTGEQRSAATPDQHEGRRPDPGDQDAQHERRRPEPDPDYFDRWM